MDTNSLTLLSDAPKVGESLSHPGHNNRGVIVSDSPEFPPTSFRFKAHTIGVFRGGASDKLAQMVEKGCCVMSMTDGSFSLIDLIKSINDVIGASHVTIATWSAGIKDSCQAVWLRRSKTILSLRMILDRSFVTRQARYAEAILSFVDIENIRTSSIHAKFVLLENEEWKIVIVTSMNLNANKNVESCLIYEGGEVFDVYKTFAEQHFLEGAPGFIGKREGVNRPVQSFFEQYEEPEPEPPPAAPVAVPEPVRLPWH